MTKAITVLYFASLGERLSCQREVIELDSAPLSLSSLKKRLAERGDNWQHEIGKASLRTAVNQTIVNSDISLKPGDEVAFFPPVTGG